MATRNMNDGGGQVMLLVDAGSIIYPAYHVLKDFSTGQGLPTGAVFGFTRTLLKLLKEQPTPHAAICFDARGPTHRHITYAEYKAHRPPMDDALAVQLPKIREVCEAFRIPIFEEPGYEADDLIAALTQRAVAEALLVLIVSGDKDLMQLVSDRVKMLKPARDPRQDLRLLDVQGVKAYLGVLPAQVVDYLALTGDAVDNVPGVPGVGEKTAIQLLQQFGSLDAVLQHCSQIPGKKLRESISTHRDQALLSAELVRLKPPPLRFSLDDCRRGSPDLPRLHRLLEELEFHSLMKDLGFEQPRALDEAALQTQIVSHPQQLTELVQLMESVGAASLDLETSSEDTMAAEIVGVALSLKPGSGYYIPVGHKQQQPAQLPLDTVLQSLRPLLESEACLVYGQNLKYDCKVLRRHGVRVQRIGFDSMLAAYLLDPVSPKDLTQLAARYLGRRVLDFSELGTANMRDVHIERAAEYAVGDAEVVLRLREKLLPELAARGLQKLFDEVELPLIAVLVEMELSGIQLNQQALQEQAKELEVLLLQLRGELFRLAGEDFNPSSPKQVACILFEKLKLPVRRRTKTGPSTDALVLRELAGEHPLVEKLLTYRELEKLLNTYIRKLPEFINPQTGRIHTSFHQGVVTTGRLSSSDPNLQNIPVRTELGGQIRKAFVASPGHLLIGADYSQLELRILAHLTGDPGLVEAFARGEDIHVRTAAAVFGLPLEQVTSGRRRIAKMINYGLSYGMTAFGLSQRTGLSRKEAEQFIQSYFTSFPGVKDYMERTVREAAQKGYVETLFGRRRYFTEVAGRSEREAINMPIQGTASDLMKLAMIRLHEAMQEGVLNARMLLQVHDELIFESAEQFSEASAQQIQQIMENIYPLRVPLRVDVHIGANWGEV